LSANEQQVGGTHYNKYGKLQVWDIFWIFRLNAFQANVVKYVIRYRDKDGLKDLMKAKHYIEKLIELEEQGVIQGAEPPIAVHNVILPICEHCTTSTACVHAGKCARTFKLDKAGTSLQEGMYCKECTTKEECSAYRKCYLT
jgi:hypothetical protein